MLGCNGFWQKHEGLLLVLQKNEELIVFDGVIENKLFKANQLFQLHGDRETPDIWVDEDGMVVIYNPDVDKLAFYHEEVEAPYTWRDKAKDVNIPHTIDTSDIDIEDIDIFNLLCDRGFAIEGCLPRCNAYYDN